TNNAITGTSNTIAVNAAGATHFVVNAPSSATAGTAFTFTVTAFDGNNNVATGYTGTIHFTSSDAAATLPADSTLTNGAGTFSSTLKTAGNQTLTATDTATSSITGTSAAISVASSESQNSRFVRQMYLDLLHRPVDAPALQLFSSLLDAGKIT